MENLLYKSGIVLHVIAGFLALTSGLVAMSYGKKGGKIHNLSGIVFYWSMAVIFVTTLLFFVLFPNNLKYQFFLTIGIVSFYPTWSGKRMLKMKKGLKPTWYDMSAAFLVGVSGLVMLGYGFLLLFKYEISSPFVYLFFVFGIVSLLNAYGDLKYYLKFKSEIKMHWFFAHGGKMIGAYSAALTAFCVNIVPRFLPENFPSFGQMILWVGPTVVFAFISAKILKKYKVKMGVV
ncbi:hypothetical protein EGI22_14075 [Lacihabitans sp. LS3-19]|uniref:hypothetical protein n=1 Tax=Lacihabitans sp. LS3-19 TaxID=2487335 RepID=UPI0020CEB42C|nr:hypothetical protein [Lacihabitans sp. LS3-19]MCP9769041.1 hypothetical protein [Lacihabitans sp. LS3-19]